MRLLRRDKPYLLIGSPMCTAFCTWMALNYAKSSDTAAIALAFGEAVAHLDFVMSMYHEQLAEGRYFLHEHPQGRVRGACRACRRC